jgi:hypothetical protein
MSIPFNSPEDVTRIAAQTAKRLKPVDLREFHGELFRVQRAKRTVNADRVFRRAAIRKFRNRVRLPLLPDCRVIDTRKDSRGQLFFELSNGQAVRADKAAGRRERSPKISNPILRDLIVAEIERNALRAAA